MSIETTSKIYSLQPVLWGVDALSRDFDSLRRSAHAARSLLFFQNPRIEPVYVMKRSQELFDVELPTVECNELFPVGEENISELVKKLSLSNVAEPIFLNSLGNSKAARAMALVEHAVNRQARLIALAAGNGPSTDHHWFRNFIDLVVERSPIPVLIGNEKVSGNSRVRKALFVTDFGNSDLKYFRSILELACEQRFDIAIYYHSSSEENEILASEWSQFAYDNGVETSLIPSATSTRSIGDLCWVARKQGCDLVVKALPSLFWLPQKKRWLARLLRLAPCPVLVQNPKRITRMD